MAQLYSNENFPRQVVEELRQLGYIVCTFDPDFIAQAQRIDLAIKAYPQLAGQLIRVNRPPQ